MIKKNLLTILGFKIVWLSCVLGELYINSLFGFFAGIIFLLFFLINEKKILLAIKTILFFSLIGYFFDSLLSFFGFYKINAQINFLFLPVWFLALWPCFCCLFINVLTFLKNKKLIATIIGAVIGPLGYYAGVSVGLASFSSIIALYLMSFFWALMMFCYSKYFSKKYV